MYVRSQPPIFPVESNMATDRFGFAVNPRNQGFEEWTIRSLDSMYQQFEGWDRLRSEDVLFSFLGCRLSTYN
jgi:hypothetical protein